MRIRFGSVIFVIMFFISVLAAEDIRIPTVRIASVVHSSDYDIGLDIQTYRDAVTFPSGPGGFSGPGFSASVGDGDTIKMRFKAPAGMKFVVTKHPTAASTGFYINAHWFTGTGDTGSYVSTGSVTFQGLRGTAPVETYNQYMVSNNGESIKAIVDFDVIGDFRFKSVEIEYTISQPLADTLRTYGTVGSFSVPSFGAAASGAGGLADPDDYGNPRAPDVPGCR